MDVWMRILSVTFTSKKYKNKLIFGENYLDGKEDLNISVTINKYMSSLKDSATIKITNLTYNEIVRLIDGEYYDVEIKVGYRHPGFSQTIFKGGVLYISNSLDDRKSNTAIILCASNLVAKYGQARLNLSLNSGINTFTALKFICKKAGINDSNISTQLKKAFIQQVINANDTAANWIEKLATNNPSYIVNSDSALSSTLNIYDAKRSAGRVLKLDSSVIQLVGGGPQLDKDGLRMSVTPTLAIMCGDTIQIDNSILDISAASSSEANVSKGTYLDKDGMYMVYRMTYSLENRGSSFTCNLNCKSRYMVSNLIGANNG